MPSDEYVIPWKLHMALFQHEPHNSVRAIQRREQDGRGAGLWDVVYVIDGGYTREADAQDVADLLGRDIRTGIQQIRESPTFTWTCEACDKPVVDGKGSLLAYYPDINEAASEARRVEFERIADEIANGYTSRRRRLDMAWASDDKTPKVARWHVLHYDCETRKDSTYDIEVGRARTHEALLDWTLHIAGKGWLEHTDWDDFIRRNIPRMDA